MSGKKQLLDKYDTTGLSYFFDIWVIVYALFYLATLVLVINFSVTHTYFKNLPGGTLYTLRYNSLQWVVAFLGPMRLLFLISVIFLVVFRKIGGCTVFWFVLVVLFWMVDVFVLGGWGIAYANCNKQGAVDNPCNDLLWCCYEPIYSQPGNECLNTVPCTPVVTSLSPNVDFLWMFRTNLVFVILETIIALGIIYLWASQTGAPSRMYKEQQQKEEEVSEDEQEPSPQKPMSKRIARAQNFKSLIQNASAVIHHQPSKMTKPE